MENLDIFSFLTIIGKLQPNDKNKKNEKTNNIAQSLSTCLLIIFALTILLIHGQIRTYYEKAK